ncbi:ABC transporter family protein [Aphelenchoides fujianensis]|nr:ABC transporter family protein [Aphelenchoides fujianensis]
MFATSLVIAFIVNWKIAAAMFLCAPFGCMTVSLMARFVAKSSRKQTEWSEKAAALLHEGVINVRTVQSCRGEGQMVQKFAAVLKGGQIHGIFVYFWSGLFEGLFFWVLYIFYMIGLCFGAFEVYHGRCTLGEVLICSNSLLIGGSILENIAMGDKEVTLEQVQRAARLANCNFIESLSDGYSTQIAVNGGSGVSLSGTHAELTNKPNGLYASFVLAQQFEIAIHGWVTEEIGDELKTRAFANVLRLDASFYDKPETANAKVVQRIGSDSNSLKAATDNRLYHLVNSTSSTTIQLVLAFIASYEIVFVGMGVYSVFIIALYVCTRKMRLAVEIIENTRAIQVIARESHFHSKFEDRLEDCRRTENKISILDSTVFALTQVSIFFSDCFTYAVGLHLLAVGRRSAAESLDGVDIRRFTLDRLRSNLAVVGQMPILFAGSIYENVCFGTPTATREDVERACREANAADFIERLPLATRFSSIEEMQLLCLQGYETEAVQKALNVASEGRTCITIAHRLSSIQSADRICYVSGGRVIEEGTHSELLALDGCYAKLVQKQNLLDH